MTLSGSAGGPARRLRLPALAAVVVLLGCPPGPLPDPTPPPSPLPPPVVSDMTIDFPNAGAGDRPLVLYSGFRQGACRRYEPHKATSSSSVPLSFVGWDPTCRTEIDVMMPGFGVFGRLVDPSVPADVAWFQNGLSLAHLSIMLPDLTPVAVKFWIVASGSTEVTEATAFLATQRIEANALYDDLGAGFVINAVTPDGTLSTVPAGLCDDLAGVIAAGYQANAINVYLIKGDPTIYAWNCWLYGHQEITFVAWGNENTPDVALAHELGHTLGLIQPSDPAIGGHVNCMGPPWDCAIAPFTKLNLMYSGGQPYDNISVGQIYNMNFAAKSWLNMGISPRPVVQPCQDMWGSGSGPGTPICPALNLFVPGWP